MFENLSAEEKRIFKVSFFMSFAWSSLICLSIHYNNKKRGVTFKDLYNEELKKINSVKGVK